MSSRRYDALATARDLESTGLERPQAEAIGSHGARLATSDDIERLGARTASKEDIARLEAQIATKADRAELYRALWIHGASIVTVFAHFVRGVIHDSYANRTGKGTHRAVARYERFRNRFRHVLRCDIYRYFPAIDHEILKRDIRRRIVCPRTLAIRPGLP